MGAVSACTCPFFVVSCRSTVSVFVFPVVGSPLAVSKEQSTSSASTISAMFYNIFKRHINEGKYTHVFLSRNLNVMSLTTASEIFSLIIPPERISTPDTYKNRNKSKIRCKYITGQPFMTKNLVYTSIFSFQKISELSKH